MGRVFFSLGSLLAALAVAAGAYASHGGASLLTENQISWLAKAARYQMYHALALLAVAGAIIHWPKHLRLLQVAGWLAFSAWYFTFLRQPLSAGLHRHSSRSCNARGGNGFYTGLVDYGRGCLDQETLMSTRNLLECKSLLSIEPLRHDMVRERHGRDTWKGGQPGKLMPALS